MYRIGLYCPKVPTMAAIKKQDFQSQFDTDIPRFCIKLQDEVDNLGSVDLDHASAPDAEEQLRKYIAQNTTIKDPELLLTTLTQYLTQKGFIFHAYQQLNSLLQTPTTSEKEGTDEFTARMKNPSRQDALINDQTLTFQKQQLQIDSSCTINTVPADDPEDQDNTITYHAKTQISFPLMAPYKQYYTSKVIIESDQESHLRYLIERNLKLLADSTQILSDHFNWPGHEKDTLVNAITKLLNQADQLNLTAFNIRCNQLTKQFTQTSLPYLQKTFVKMKAVYNRIDFNNQPLDKNDYTKQAQFETLDQLMATETTQAPTYCLTSMDFYQNFLLIEGELGQWLQQKAGSSLSYSLDDYKQAYTELLIQKLSNFQRHLNFQGYHKHNRLLSQLDSAEDDRERQAILGLQQINLKSPQVDTTSETDTTCKPDTISEASVHEVIQSWMQLSNNELQTIKTRNDWISEDLNLYKNYIDAELNKMHYANKPEPSCNNNANIETLNWLYKSSQQISSITQTLPNLNELYNTINDSLNQPDKAQQFLQFFSKAKIFLHFAKPESERTYNTSSLVDLLCLIYTQKGIFDQARRYRQSEACLSQSNFVDQINSGQQDPQSPSLKATSSTAPSSCHAEHDPPRTPATHQA